MLPIIPVLDLMGGQIVRAVGGRRREYRPVETALCAGAEPVAVARAFAEKLGLTQLYLADLDAIEGGEPDWETYRALLALGVRLWIDAGLSTTRRAGAMAELPAEVTGVVAGLESLPKPAMLAEMLAVVGPERLIFSLDLKAGKPLARCARWRDFTPLQIAEHALAAGVRRVILLDLARVGNAAGAGTEALCQAVRARAPHIELVAGGGVRDRCDLERLAAADCDAALVASALHRGQLP
jgi:phosphoribosylformimino-5-aminoimidazole carboxamide ribotide isomerase